MTQPTAAETWLYSKLSADATLLGLVSTRIYGYVAPPQTTYPLVIYQYQAGHDVGGVSAVRIMSQEVYVVKAVGRDTSFSTLKPIAKRIDELLHRASGSTADGQVLACVREQPFRMVEVEDGIEYRYLGGIYRIFVAG
jgi:hypothetical protein